MTSQNSVEFNFLEGKIQEQTSCDKPKEVRNNSDVQKAQQAIYRAIAFLNEVDVNPHYQQRIERDDIANNLLWVSHLLGQT